MTSWWKALFSSETEERPRAVLDPRGMERAVERVANTPGKSKKLAEEAAKEALELMHEQLAALRAPISLFYSTAGMNTSMWMEGAAIAAFTEALADELEERALGELEEAARAACVEMTCILMATSPEQIFPRVLKHGECNERLGRVEAAVRCYSKIARDFEALELDVAFLSEAHAEEVFDEPEQIILENAETALLRLAALAPEDARPELLAKIGVRLEARDLADVIALPRPS